MKELRTALQSGQHVEVRDEAWLVVTTEQFERAALVTLRGIGDDNLGERRQVLTPFDRIRLARQRTGIAVARRFKVLQTAAAIIAASPPWCECWTVGAAHIDLRPWQLEPALAAIAGTPRILLADEVGLGKTIQAALIVSELLARGLAKRVLILTPASLGTQWASELWIKFGISATVFDHATLRTLTATLPPAVNPWKTAPVMVSSIDLVKRPEFRAALDDVPLDVLIVDEAHHVTPGTDRGSVVAHLAARTQWTVLATATPHSGDETAYRFLRRLGGIDDESELATYQRAAADVCVATPRRVHLLAVASTPFERALLDATLAYSRLLWRGARAQSSLGLVASVIARRAASSAAAARQTLERRLALIGGTTLPIVQAPLPWDEGDIADESIGDDILAVPGLADCRDEIAWLERLVDLAGAASVASSKIGVIRRLLRRTDEQLIIFSEYRDVVQDMAMHLADLTRVTVIHGGVVASVRRDRIQAFNAGRVRVLITTDAAGEGLNLQERCRLVVNLELPWNPLRLEQRIGRVDRLGQRRRVHAIHLFHRGSFEETVLAYVERRRALALATIHKPAAPTTITAFVETERRLRRLVKAGGRSLTTAKPVFARTCCRRRLSSSIVLLFAADIVDATGRLVQRALIPVGLRSHRGVRLRKLSKALVVQLTTSPGLHAVLQRELSDRLSSISGEITVTATAMERRSRSILSVLNRRHTDPLFQGALFDRRAERRARVRDAGLRALQEHFARKIDAARALTSLQASQPRLVAVWLAE